jgi:hypothetical protein
LVPAQPLQGRRGKPAPALTLDISLLRSTEEVNETRVDA